MTYVDSNIKPNDPVTFERCIFQNFRSFQAYWLTVQFYCFRLIKLHIIININPYVNWIALLQLQRCSPGSLTFLNLIGVQPKKCGELKYIVN